MFNANDSKKQDHPLMGKKVKVTTANVTGTVTRTMSSFFGVLVFLNGKDDVGYSAFACVEIKK